MIRINWCREYIGREDYGVCIVGLLKGVAVVADICKIGDD